MNTKDLGIFDEMPFLFWVRDEEGRYLFANRAVLQMAGEDVSGKTDRDLIWAGDAEALRAADKRVFETGKPMFLHESANTPGGQVTLGVCKWRGELDGKKRGFGISFVIE
jgi:PAS domain-containing protein